jgi:hypothetical protein
LNESPSQPEPSNAAFAPDPRPEGRSFDAGGAVSASLKARFVALFKRLFRL